MGISLHYDLSELKIAKAQQQRLANLDTRPLAAEIGEHLLSETLINFEQQVTPEGDAWKPSKRAERDGGKTLQDRGHLRDSYTTKGAEGNIFDVDPGGVTVGSAMQYAAIHHAGGQAGRNLAVTIEPRPALGMTDDLLDEIGEMALDYIEAAA